MMFARAILNTGVCLAGLAWTTLAIAQEVSPQPAAENAAPGEIVVTAQKRTERLQEVPISAAVVGGAALQNNAIRNLQDLKVLVPAVQISHAGPTDRLFIRGIGSGDNPAFDQAVATFIDDVYHGRSRSTGSGLFDIERSEFLKGPQSTFFGNSAIGGAINITTVKPSDTLKGYLFSSYNFNFDQYVVEGAVGGPIAEGLTGRVSVLFGQGDGWIVDTSAGGKVPETNDRAVRLQLQWQPNDRLQFNLKGEAGRFNQRGGLTGQIINCPPVIATPTQNGFPGPAVYCASALAAGDDVVFNDRRASPRGTHSNISNREVTLAASYDLGSAALTSTTSYSDYDFKAKWANDYSSAGSFPVGAPEKYHQFSEELRLASDDSGLVNYTAGLYYQNDRIKGRNVLDYTFLATPVSQVLGFDQDEKIYAAFASLGFNLSDKLTITGGVRGQRVEKDLTKSIFYGNLTGYSDNTPVPTAALNAAGQASGLGPVGSWRFKRSDSKLTPSANIRYKFSRDLMAYASYSNGFKAGGFNFVGTGPLNPATGWQDNIPFSPEKVDSFEVGFKSQLFDRRLTLNVAAFHSRYSNLQVGGNLQTAIGPVNVVSNAASSITRGIELEADLRVSSALRTGLQFSLLDAHYKSFPGALPTACQQRVGQCVFGSTTPGVTSQNLSGEHTPYAPKYSGTWTVDYELPLSEAFKLALGSQLFFTDHFQVAVNNDPYTVQKSYVQLDLSARLLNTAGGWEIGVVAKNVNDVKTFHWGASLPRSSGSFIVAKDPPRSFAVQARKTF